MLLQRGLILQQTHFVFVLRSMEGVCEGVDLSMSDCDSKCVYECVSLSVCMCTHVCMSGLFVCVYLCICVRACVLSNVSLFS